MQCVYRNLVIYSAIVISISAITFAHYFNDSTPVYETPFVVVNKNIVKPLDNIRVTISTGTIALPVVLVIRSKDDNFTIDRKEIDEPTNFVSIIMSGPSGKYEVVLEKDGVIVSNTVEIDIIVENTIQTSDEQLNSFYSTVKGWMGQNTSVCEGVKGYRSPDTDTIWLRDYTYQMFAFKYWEDDMKLLLDSFFEHQKDDGKLPDFLCPYPVRVSVEADVEYLAVLAAYQVWQATGDDIWIQNRLPNLEKALSYTLNNANRWSADQGLVKRGFTIDTWDFQWGHGSNTINEKTKFGLLVTDNSGFYYASMILSQLYDYFGDKNATMKWRELADTLRKNSNEYLWDDVNGYYKSFVHIDNPVPNVTTDETQILTLGNTISMNRGAFTDHEQAVRIISEYMKRANSVWKDRWGNKHVIFKEWFSVNPDYGYKKFNSGSQAELSGGYVNGGIMPLVGGELSKAAFKHGFERYAVKQIRDYISMTEKDGNKTYLWYWPDGTPGKDEQTISTDGWGSGTFLSSFIEGLVGVEDKFKSFENILFSPRWPSADIDNALIILSYGPSKKYIAYKEQLYKKEKTIFIDFASSGARVNGHILLPDNTKAEFVKIDGEKVSFQNVMVESSAYVDFSFNSGRAKHIEIKFIQ